VPRRPGAATAIIALTGLALAGLALTGPVAWAATFGTSSGRPAGPQASTARGTVQISGYSSNDGPKSVVVLTGAIGDYGDAVRTATVGQNGAQYTQLHLSLTRGSFRLNVAGIENQLVTDFRYFPSKSRTCSGVVTVNGTAPIVSGSGTGAYKGISGALQLTTTVHEVDSYPGCASLLAETVYTTGSGTVAFGT
jgi:hypothetical protein